jgi:hypothetical protein
MMEEKMENREAIANIEYARKWLGSESDFSDEALDMAISALEKQEQDRWRPVFDGDGEMPEVNEDGYSDYILVNFSNIPEMFDIAQYRVNESGEGAFYSGDDEDPYTKIGVFVSAWRPLPEPYKEEES